MSADTDCPTCAGCGQIANDDDRTPWKYWAELLPPSNLAVTLGIVRPVTCPDCYGSGWRNGTSSPDETLAHLRAQPKIVTARPTEGDS